MSRKPDTIVGRIPVLESLRAGKRSARRLSILESAKGLEEIVRAAGVIPVAACRRPDLDRLAGGTQHQGVVLEADPLPVYPLDAWLRRPLAQDAIVLILDGIEDPHNFGAIVRSAAACGAAGVVFAKDRAAPVSAAAYKSAAGAMEYVDLIQVTNVVRSIQMLQQEGFWATALEADADVVLWEADLLGRVALIIGSEGQGIRRLVRKRCDRSARIPLSGPITSLNASVSAAIALVECVRQRCMAGKACSS